MGAGRLNRAVRSARQRGTEIGRNCARLDVPWARCGFARFVRETFLSYCLGPMMDLYVRARAIGSNRFDALKPPVVFVANHSSHLDTPAILRSLPRKWRQRTAVAAAADYFYTNRLVAHAVSLIFNTVPIQRRGGGLGKDSTAHVESLIDQRWNLLLFPEGTRSRDGRIGRLRSGAAVIAAEHDLTIVPIYVAGTHDAMPPGRSWPKRKPGRPFSRRHKVEVRFGEPITPAPGEHRSDVMDRVRAFMEQQQGPKPGAGGNPIPGLGERVNGNGAAPGTPGEPTPPVARAG
jgi:1-acyl-sn-glycerol-3-phosphate acyltransferase